MNKNPKRQDIKRNEDATKFGNAYGNFLKNGESPKRFGYCLAGSANLIQY
jgi:hypothetical protein